MSGHLQATTSKERYTPTTFSATTELSYDPGLVVPPTQRLCARTGTVTAAQFDVSVGVSGYIANS